MYIKVFIEVKILRITLEGSQSSLRISGNLSQVSTGRWVYFVFYFYFCKYSYMQHTLLNFRSLKNHTSNNLKHENTNTGWPAKLGIMFPGEFQVFRKKSNAKCTNVQMPIFQVCCRIQLPEISYKSIHATQTSVNLHAPLGSWK